MSFLLNELQFKEKALYLHICKFSHDSEDQIHCNACGSRDNELNCPKIHEAWLKFNAEQGLDESSLLLMSVL